MKYLLLLLAVLLLLWMLFGRNRTRRPPRDDAAPRATGGPEEMSRCARCGVHLPRSEALLASGQLYCSAEHRDAGPRADGR
jgi:uncharacterized protein